MDETYRMLGREHEGDLAREAAARQRAAALHRAGGVTRAQVGGQTAETPRRGVLRLALGRLVPLRGI